MTIQLRKDTAGNWTAANPVLADGQPGVEQDTRKWKVGDGTTAWAALAYFNVSAGTGGVTDVTGTAPIASSGGATPAISIVAATGSVPGSMSAADKTKLDAISGTNTGDQTSIVGITGTKAQFDTAVTDGNVQFVGDAPTAHTHLLAAGATDVTVTAANLNLLDDGANTALHFHNADRARADHTGTQLAATISDFATATAATASVTANTAKITNATHTGDVTGSTVLTIANDAVTNARLANMATASIKGRVTAATGDPEDLTATQVRTLINVASGATANSTDADLLARANHTGTQLAATVSDFATATAATASVTANTAKITNATHTGDATGDAVLTIANDAVTNAKAANMATATIKGRTTAGTGDPEDLTPAQARTVLELGTAALLKIAVGTTAPGSPATGDLWVDTN